MAWRAILKNGGEKELTEVSIYMPEKGVALRALGQR